MLIAAAWVTATRPGPRRSCSSRMKAGAARGLLVPTIAPWSDPLDFVTLSDLVEGVTGEVDPAINGR